MKQSHPLRRTGVTPVSSFKKLVQRWVPVRGYAGPFLKDVAVKLETGATSVLRVVAARIMVTILARRECALSEPAFM
jgi:hypothetical protein